MVDCPNVNVELGWEPAGCCPKEGAGAAEFWEPAPKAKTEDGCSDFVVEVELNIPDVVVAGLFVPKLNTADDAVEPGAKLNPPVDEETVVVAFGVPNAKTPGAAAAVVVTGAGAGAGFCPAKLNPPAPLELVG